MTEKIHKSDEEWKQQLTPEQYSVTRQQGTEPAFSGTYYHHKAKGTYHCICCENPLFLSENKFELAEFHATLERRGPGNQNRPQLRDDARGNLQPLQCPPGTRL